MSFTTEFTEGNGAGQESEETIPGPLCSSAASSSVLVLGAGLIGLCSALECARRGMRVTIVDRAPARRDGC